MSDAKFERGGFIFIIALLLFSRCFHGHPEVKIDLDTYSEIYDGLIDEIEITCQSDSIDISGDDIYTLADGIIPYIIEQIEKRGNEAIEEYYTKDEDVEYDEHGQRL